MSGAVAEFNFGRLRHDWTDRRVAPFVQALERVNVRAARSPGFLWRMPDDQMEAAQLGPPLNDARVASTLSVWGSAEDLYAFVYDGVHNAFLRRGGEWFEPHDGPSHVVWPVGADHRPDVEEGLARLRTLEENGPSAECFDLAWFAEMRGAA